MSNLSSEARARDFIEKIELWCEFALGPKDILRGSGTAAAPDEGSRNPDLPRQLYDIYRGHLHGSLSESTWRRFLITLPMLLSTTHFTAQWDATQAQFPEGFRALIRDLRR